MITMLSPKATIAIHANERAIFNKFLAEKKEFRSRIKKTATTNKNTDKSNQ
jgi:hypothetical protein